MRALTAKQLEFVRLKAEGVPNAKAMIAAGFSAGGAAQNASALLARPDIKAAIKAARKSPIERAIGNMQRKLGHDADDETELAKTKLPKAKYADPKELLLDAMNHPGLGVTTRAGFAVQLMPYMHARIADKGKKETALDKAKGVAGGKEKARADGRPKFAPGKPPKLHAVK